MNFSSDNVTGACPEILDALNRTNEGSTMPYGNDEGTPETEKRIAAVFETDADVLLVATGTAANALSLSVLTPPYGNIYCHRDAHIEVDECGAPGFYSGGAKTVPLDGEDGKLTPDALIEAFERTTRGVHQTQPACVSLTQATEAGTLYTPIEIRAIADAAHDRGLAVHMDGARFANAVAALGCPPADITWKAGVDALTFGASKNGAFAAEAVVLFRQGLAKGLAEDLAYRRKRGGHLFSKMRFITAQFDAYLKDDLWLNNARHANDMAARLASGLDAIDAVSLSHPVQANEIFITLPAKVADGLKADGFGFYRWDRDAMSGGRLVTAFNTRPEDVDAFISSARQHAE